MFAFNKQSFNKTTLHSMSATSDSYMDIYPGQTTVLRFNLILIEPNSFNLKLELTSTIAAAVQPLSVFDIERFYVSFVGINYPCVHTQLGSASFAANTAEFDFSVGSTLSVGDVDYMPIDSKNLTSSTVSRFKILN